MTLTFKIQKGDDVLPWIFKKGTAPPPPQPHPPSTIPLIETMEYESTSKPAVNRHRPPNSIQNGAHRGE